MWSSSTRGLAFAAALSAVSVLSGCTGFTPVYMDAGSAPSLQFAEPVSRLDQVVYNDLALRFGPPKSGAPKLTVRASAGSRGLTSDLVSHAFSQKQVTVSARYSLIDGKGKTLLSETRTASADYESGPQLVANQQAQDDAAERAAHLLADTIRLSVLGALAK